LLTALPQGSLVDVDIGTAVQRNGLGADPKRRRFENTAFVSKIPEFEERTLKKETLE
jgi:hypothetical protein